MEMAVEYARDRKQFGRADRLLPGRLAPLRADAARGRGRALGQLLRGPGARTRSPRRWRSPAAWRRRTRRTPAGACCTSSLQVHGGIGFTWEHDLHFFLSGPRSTRCSTARRASTATRSAEAVGRPAEPRQRLREHRGQRRQHAVAARAPAGRSQRTSALGLGHHVAHGHRGQASRAGAVGRGRASATRRWGAWRPRSRRTPSGPTPPSPPRSGRDRRACRSPS